MRTIIGIDPGSSGGIAWQHGDEKPCAVKMPETPGDVVETLRGIQFNAEKLTDDCEAHVELVGGHVGKNQPGSTMFVFGKGAGIIEGALMALGIRIILHRPQAWQKTFGFGKKTKRTTAKGKVVTDDTAWKNKLKAESQRRFPHLKVTNATADALLILEHGRGVK